MSKISADNIQNADLAPRSKQLYMEYINVLANRLFKGNCEELARNPRLVHEHLRSKFKDAYATIGIYFTAINKMLDVSPNFKLPKNTRDLWSKYRKDMRLARLNLYNKNQLSEKDTQNVVGFKELHSKFCEMQNDPMTHMLRRHHLQYVLFAVYLNIRPKRADLGNVYIAQTLSEIPKEYATKGNFIVLTGYPRLVMNRYKTQERYGRIVEPLNNELVAILKDSVMVRYPRNYLITQTRNPDQPYTINNSYGQFVKRAFNEHFEGRAMSPSLWRHVFVAENVDFVNTPNEELMKNARFSGQSLTTQLLIYKNVNLPSNMQQRTHKEKEAPIKCPPHNVKADVKSLVKAYIAKNY